MAEYKGSRHKVQILVQFGSLSNIDMYKYSCLMSRTGLYHIKTRVYTKSHKGIGGVRRIDGNVVKNYDTKLFTANADFKVMLA
jgi:rRNA processing protein Gar1